MRSRKSAPGHHKAKKAGDQDAKIPQAGKVVCSSDVGWVGPITMRKKAKPELENVRYRDISLRISVQEVKNLAFKGRYFCELCLDRTLYARTTSKQSNGTVFWGEKFELNNLPEISIITINLYRHGSGSSKEKRQRHKDQNQFVAFVTIPLADLPSTGAHQQWLTMQSTTVNPKLGHPLPADRCGHPGHPRESESRNIGSPNGVRFRKRSMPVTCFRHSSSTTTFGALSGLMRSPDANESINDNRKKRSWTSGATVTAEPAAARRGTPFGNKSASDTTSSSPGYDSTRLSFPLSECSPPQIRLSLQYESIDVLPLNYYFELREFLRSNSTLLVRTLEPILSAKQKEELASCLVNIHEKLPHFNVAVFLAELLEDDIKQNADGVMLLRSNSTASKAVECYIKLVGSEYLQRVLKSFIDQLLVSPEDFEIDPSRLKAFDSSASPGKNDFSAQMGKNYFSLLKHMTIIWKRIIETSGSMPIQLREVFRTLRELLERTHETDVAVQVISSCLFLRFICPAIHGPVLFGLTDCVPESGRISRNLTLVAKVLQNLANLTIFEDKEPHMKALNSFVSKEIPIMRSFLENISSAPQSHVSGDTLHNDCHEYIDLGYEFAKISSLFCDYIRKVELPSELAQLPSIVSFIVEHTTDAVLSPWVNEFPSYQDSCEGGQFLPPRPSYGGTEDTQTEHWQSYMSGSQPSIGSPALSASSKSITSAVNRSYDTNTPHSNALYVESTLSPQESAMYLLEAPSSNLPNGVITDGVGTSADTMDDLFVQYREQLRQLNACIDRVENISVASDAGRPDQNEGVFNSSIVEAGIMSTTWGRDRVCEAADRSDTITDRGKDGLVYRLHRDEHYIQLNSSDQLANDSAYGVDLGGIHNDDVFINGSTSEQPMLSQSPSLDQLAEKLQELKRLLKSEREELAQVVATKTQVICAQEQSIQQLTSEIDQLRRLPNVGTRFLSGSSVNRYTPGTVSPSSSFSSECFFSTQSDDVFPSSNSGVDQTTRPEASNTFQQTKQTPPVQPVRSQSLLNRLRSAELETIGTKQVPNLLDLSRASVGTGIPLGRLIMAKHPPQFRRRFSETRMVPN